VFPSSPESSPGTIVSIPDPSYGGGTTHSTTQRVSLPGEHLPALWLAGRHGRSPRGLRARPPMTPARIQLRRAAGWRKPPNAVMVTRPHSKFANPYRIGYEARDAAEAVAMFRLYLLARPDIVAAARAELAGRTLACWCRPGDPCHADVLLETANAPEDQ
jgi:hypothetical protein